MIRRLSFMLSAMVFASQVGAAGFDEHYKVLKGDFNGDGFPDLYLQYNPDLAFVNVGDIQTPIALTPRGVGEFVLQNNGSGVFTVVSATSAQIRAVAWTNTDITTAVGNINADYVLDVMLRDTDSEIAGAAKNVTIVANMNDGVVPQSVGAVAADAEVALDQVLAWILNPDYFNDLA